MEINSMHELKRYLMKEKQQLEEYRAQLITQSDSQEEEDLKKFHAINNQLIGQENFIDKIIAYFGL